MPDREFYQFQQTAEDEKFKALLDMLESSPTFQCVTQWCEAMDFADTIGKEILHLIGCNRSVWLGLCKRVIKLLPDMRYTKSLQDMANQCKEIGMPNRHPIVQQIKKKIAHCYGKNEGGPQMKDFPFHGLLYAAASGDLENVKFWIETVGLSPDFRQGFDQTALMIAARLDELEICEYLVKAGADLEAVDNYSNTPLHFACFRCGGPHKRTISFLLEAGADYLHRVDLTTVRGRLKGTPEKQILDDFITKNNGVIHPTRRKRRKYGVI